jgi:hypothetical protein
MADKKINSGNVGRVIQEQIANSETPVPWRAWGSWWSWGTPTGLGLFFVLTAFAVWILFHL